MRGRSLITSLWSLFNTDDQLCEITPTPNTILLWMCLNYSLGVEINSEMFNTEISTLQFLLCTGARVHDGSVSSQMILAATSCSSFPNEWESANRHKCTGFLIRFCKSFLCGIIPVARADIFKWVDLCEMLCILWSIILFFFFLCLFTAAQFLAVP